MVQLRSPQFNKITIKDNKAICEAGATLYEINQHLLEQRRSLKTTSALGNETIGEALRLHDNVQFSNYNLN